MDNPDQKWIVSGRIGCGEAKPAPGSDVSSCSECGHAVWLSPSSLQVISEDPENFTVICMDCAEPHIKQHPEEIMPVNNGQLKEIASYFGISMQEAAMKIAAMMEREFGKG